MVEKKSKPVFFKNARPHNWLDDAKKQKEKESKVGGKAKKAARDS